MWFLNRSSVGLVCVSVAVVGGLMCWEGAGQADGVGSWVSGWKKQKQEAEWPPSVAFSVVAAQSILEGLACALGGGRKTASGALLANPPTTLPPGSAFVVAVVCSLGAIVHYVLSKHGAPDGSWAPKSASSSRKAAKVQPPPVIPTAPDHHNRVPQPQCHCTPSSHTAAPVAMGTGTHCLSEQGKAS